MTHYTTLVQRCRATNSLLADQIAAEFQRIERERAVERDLWSGKLQVAEDALKEIASRCNNRLQAIADIAAPYQLSSK